MSNKNQKIEKLFSEYLSILLTFLENKKASENEIMLMKKVFWGLHDKIQEEIKLEIEKSGTER
jgi:hypothetical protein